MKMVKCYERSFRNQPLSTPGKRAAVWLTFKCVIHYYSVGTATVVCLYSLHNVVYFNPTINLKCVVLYTSLVTLWILPQKPRLMSPPWPSLGSSPVRNV